MFLDQVTAGLIYIDELLSFSKEGGSYQGYWVQASSAVKCESQRMMKGVALAYWGQFQMQMLDLDPTVPQHWKAKWGYCEQEPTEVWQGMPLTN